MTLQAIGRGTYLPMAPRISMGPSFSSSLVIDASAEKVSFLGCVWNKDHATKSITKVGFRFGAVTKAGGSGLTVSLQNVSLTVSTSQPDGTQDQTVAIANADAGFVSNSWYMTDALSASRSVAYGELLAVVIEYDGAGRLGADTVEIEGLNGTDLFLQPATALLTASWVSQTIVPNIIFEFTDGTFGTFDGAFPLSALAAVAFKQDTAGSDEYALESSYPFSCKVDGMWAVIAAAAVTSDFDIVLYEGTTELEAVSVDGHSLSVIGARVIVVPFPERELTANTTYYLAVKPTQTASTVSAYYFDVAAANHFQAHELGPTCRLASRLDLGAWSSVSTRRMWAGLHISALDDGVGGGGGAGSIFGSVMR